MVFWETTAGCNLACLHCRRLEVSKELTKSDLDHGKAMKVIQQISKVGNPILVFSAGEPLMRPDLFELASFARVNGLEAALATNGTLINDQVAQKIKKTMPV